MSVSSAWCGLAIRPVLVHLAGEPPQQVDVWRAFLHFAEPIGEPDASLVSAQDVVHGCLRTGTGRIPEFVQLVVGFERREQNWDRGGAADPTESISRRTADLGVRVPLQYPDQLDDSTLVAEIVQVPARVPANGGIGIIQQWQHQLDRPRGVDS